MMDLDMNDHGESDDTNGDGEGVWSPDIEQCFREALLLFPPCGRRKHILQEEGGGKMYGRNELIARHIMMRTGKSRTRKQVSSHIQVLARRKAKAEAASTGSGISPSPSSGLRSHSAALDGQQSQPAAYYDVWMDRPIANQKIRLVEFSAFIEHRNFQTRCLPVPAQHQQPSSITNDLAHMDAATSLNNVEQEVTLRASNQQHMISNQMQPYNAPQQQATATTHPLASNHQLPAQFNQASYQCDSIQSNNDHHQHPQKVHSLQAPQRSCMPVNNNLHSTHTTMGSSMRHSYVKIDYRQSLGQQTNKLEMIPLKEIHDKFPEIGGTEGLFQRGPSDAFFVVKFWADLNNDYEYNIEDQNSYFGFSSHFETVSPYKGITCSTKACSYGLQVVEKVEKIYGSFNSSNGRYSYDIDRSPMCDFMVHFIKKLRQLPEATQMDSVLENFTVLQVITRESTSEILLCMAYLFETAKSIQNNGPYYHVYKLTKD